MIGGVKFGNANGSGDFITNFYKRANTTPWAQSKKVTVSSDIFSPEELKKAVTKSQDVFSYERADHCPIIDNKTKVNIFENKKEGKFKLYLMKPIQGTNEEGVYYEAEWEKPWPFFDKQAWANIMVGDAAKAFRALCITRQDSHPFKN
jgi:hypothetical protein